jgi:hypothetical protein
MEILRSADTLVSEQVLKKWNKLSMNYVSDNTTFIARHINKKTFFLTAEISRQVEEKGLPKTFYG